MLIERGLYEYRKNTGVNCVCAESSLVKINGVTWII